MNNSSQNNFGLIFIISFIISFFLLLNNACYRQLTSSYTNYSESLLLSPIEGLICPQTKILPGKLPRNHELRISADSTLSLKEWEVVNQQRVSEIVGTSEPGLYNLFYAQTDIRNRVVFSGKRQVRFPGKKIFRLEFDCEDQANCPTIDIYPVYINGRAARFVAHDQRRPQRILASQGSTLFISEDGCISWRPLNITGFFNVGFFLSENRILLHEHNTRRIVYDLSNDLVISQQSLELGWHMSWNCNEANGIVMYAEYSSVYQDNKVYRTKDHGSTWDVVFELPESEPPPIRHFHTIQPDPFNEGYWYLSSGDRPHESRMWLTKDDGENWIEITADVTDKPYNQAIHRTTAKYFLSDYIIWGTDDRAGTDETLLVEARLVNDRLELEQIGKLGDELIRCLIRLDEGFLFISERKITERGARKASEGVYVIFYDPDTHVIAKAIIPVSDVSLNTGFTYSRSSFCSGSRFFTFGDFDVFNAIDGSKRTQMFMWSVSYN